MDEVDRRAEKYRNTHCTTYVCPYCNAFLVPWSWGCDVNQFTCMCNVKIRKGSPSWYQKIKNKNHWASDWSLVRNSIKSDWSFFNGIQWMNPSRIPILFNPSVRQ